MKTISKKMLSVLMAVLVLLGGVWVSFKIEPAADTIAYDTTYDYTGSEYNNNYGAWNYSALGTIGDANGGNGTYKLNKWDGDAGVSPQYGDLGVAWGTANPYLIYKVAGGTKFEASFALIGNDKRTDWKNNKSAEFEFKIEASANADNGWKNAEDTTGLSGEVLYAHDGSNIEKIVVTYDVPEDCEYVKITFPQKGILPGTDARLNDFAYLAGVKMFKVKPAPVINYDTTYDYSSTEYTGDYGGWNYAAIGAEALNPSYFLVKGDASNPGLGGHWEKLGVTWGTADMYVVYKVAGGTKFEASFKMHDAATRNGYAAKTGEPFEFKIESSASVDSGWANAATTAGQGADAVITYDVPAGCEYVKITFPQKGIIPTTDYRGNDAAYLTKVRMFKTAPDTPDTPDESIAYDTTHDYSSTEYTGDYGGWNYAAIGAEALNPSYFLVKGDASNPGLGGHWEKLGVTWGTADMYVVYKVAGGTKFEATFKMHDAATRNGYAAKTGEPFEFKIESSASVDSGWANAVTTAGQGADAVITYDVPAGCEYVKITFPQKGIIPTTDYRGNDAAYLTKVRMFKTAPAPVINYDTTYDYSSTEYTGDYGGWNYAAIGAEALNPSYFLVKGDASNPGLGGHWEKLGVTWGTADMYVVYKVAGGTKFEASFKMHDAATRNGYAAKTGEPFEFKIESSASVDSGWANAVTTAGQGADAVITYDVPAGCEYVKITFPQKGIIPTTDYRGNDAAYLTKVRMFKTAPDTPDTPDEPIAYDTTHDYSGSAYAGDYGGWNYNALGAYDAYYGGNADYTLVKDAGKGIGLEPNWGKLNVTWGTADFYLIYHVTGGTKFEASFKMHDAATRNGYAAKTGEPFEFKIESSAANDSGWANEQTTAGKGTDAVITYDVPAGCEYVKITFPQKGIIPNSGDYRANDAAYLTGVKYFKYVDPVVPQPPIPYDKTYDYSSSEYSGDYGGWNYDALGAEALNPSYFLTKVSASDPGLGGHYGQLGVTWGTADMYVIYRVAGGNKFEASFKMHSAATRNGYAAKTGEPFEFKIESSASINGGWANEQTTAGQGTDPVITYDVPADCSYVKITFPQKGIIPTTDYRANDAAYLKGVKFFEYVPYVGTYDTTYDYSDTTIEAENINGLNIAQYGIHSYNNSVKAPSLVINEVIGNDYRGGIGVDFVDLGVTWNSIENSYVIYEVKPGTDFEAIVRMIGDKANFSDKTGEPFEVTVEASSNDMNGWKNKVDTTSATSVAVGGYRDYTITYKVPDDCSFVKITFPQKGIIPGTNSRANDAARLMKVRLNAAKNYFEGCETVMNYKANGAVNFFYDNEAALLYLYKTNGIVINNFSNGAAYVAPSIEYLNSGTNIAKPYVMYAVEGGTKFVASINVNRTQAAALGAGFVMKFYESTNGTNWTQAATQVESVGDIDYHTFTLAATTKYVKIEYPHTDAVKATNKVNEVYGLIAVGFNANESAYEISNPYGNYKFTHVDKFYGDEITGFYDVKNYNIYEDIGGVFNFEVSLGDPYDHLTYMYINLYKNTGSDPCGLVYNVKPGTAFQAVVHTSRNNGDCQIVEKVTGKPFDIMVQISSDGKTWTDYTPSRILTDKHLAELKNVNDPSRYATEIITIPVIPADAKFVRLMYPHTAAVKVMTNGVDDRAGNDFIGLVQVSFTKGDAIPTYLYDADRSKYEDIYDFTEDTYDLTALNPTGVEYTVHLGALTPSWGYFYNTNKAIREKCAVTVSVKEGSAFYLDFAFRPDRLQMFAGQNYDVKLLFSSDMINWTDVTAKYVTYAPSFGDLSASRRFEIDKLPAGVKYVKVEYPHDHDMRGDKTSDGSITDLLGNDNCGIKRIYFTADDHNNYEHIIQHGYYIEEFGDDFPEDVNDDVAKVFGFYDYTKDAFTIHNYTDYEAYDGRIAIKESYLYNKAKIDNPYIVYNVVPGTEFYMKVATSSGTSRLTIMPTARMKLFASETGEDGTWKEITNYFYSDVANNSMTQYYVNNVGDKTNFIKVVYPNDGDLVAQGKAEGASGADFFTLKEVRATLVDYDPNWEETIGKIDFTKPDTDNNVDNDNVVVNPFNWLWVIIPAAAVLVLAAAAVVIFIIIKKKKSADQ